MAALEILLSENIEAEFNPDVVIFANDEARFGKFAAHIQKSFACSVHAFVPEEFFETVRPGTIFYISFNLKSEDALALARTIEQRHQMIAIVFAEVEGVETAAKLSSSRMNQTLQYPYTEKNFLMAVQTIVNKRKVQHDKNLRKLQVLERRKGVTEAAEVAAAESAENQTFKAAPSLAANGGMIIQKGRFFRPSRDRVFKGVDTKSLQAVQKGLGGATFSAIEAGPRSMAFNISKDASVKSGMSIVQQLGASSQVLVSPPVAKPVRKFGESDELEDSVTEKPSSILEVKKKSELFEIWAHSEIRDRIQRAVALVESRVLDAGEALIGYAKKRKKFGTANDTAVSMPVSIQKIEMPAPVVIIAKIEPAPVAVSALEETTALPGGLNVPTWVLIVVCLMGIAVCGLVLHAMISR